MKIGYPCINRTLKCRGNKTFRLKSYSDKRLAETVTNNIECLIETLEFNVRHNLLFFRITSDLVPFASHPVCTLNWQKHFKSRLEQTGRFISDNGIRISMHPDQFTLINSPSAGIFRRSRAELAYHCRLLDLMSLDESAKVQIHIGGVYGDKKTSLERFAGRYLKLSRSVRKRLVIENDEKCYNAADALSVHKTTGVPVLFDMFHDKLNPSGSSLENVFSRVASTWKAKDGAPMVDYSSLKKGGRRGSHAEKIDIEDFMGFMRLGRKFDFDVMLEIKDKETSALKARRALDEFFQHGVSRTAGEPAREKT